MRYAYKKPNGLAQDLRFVTSDYALVAGELEGNGEPLPSLESLSDPAAIALRDTPIDISNVDNLDKVLKSLALLTRQYANALKSGTYVAKTVADTKADFKAIFQALP